MMDSIEELALRRGVSEEGIVGASSWCGCSAAAIVCAVVLRRDLAGVMPLRDGDSELVVFRCSRRINRKRGLSDWGRMVGQFDGWTEVGEGRSAAKVGGCFALVVGEALRGGH